MKQNKQQNQCFYILWNVVQIACVAGGIVRVRAVQLYVGGRGEAARRLGRSRGDLVIFFSRLLANKQSKSKNISKVKAKAASYGGYSAERALILGITGAFWDTFRSLRS